MIDIEKIVGAVSKQTKQGSTRIVYFPVNKKRIIIDGVETLVDTVLKVAKPHTIERYTDRCDLGIFQNKTEMSDIHSKYGILVKNQDETYTTNPNGILSPILNQDARGNWIEMLRLEPMTPYHFNGLTANQEYPAGLSFDNAMKTAQKYYSNLAKLEGISHPDYIEEGLYQNIKQHPWMKLYLSWMEVNDMSPFDFVTKNLGYFSHPLTTEKTIGICDYGFSEEYDKYFDLIENSS